MGGGRAAGLHGTGRAALCARPVRRSRSRSGDGRAPAGRGRRVDARPRRPGGVHGGLARLRRRRDRCREPGSRQGHLPAALHGSVGGSRGAPRRGDHPVAGRLRLPCAGGGGNSRRRARAAGALAPPAPAGAHPQEPLRRVRGQSGCRPLRGVGHARARSGGVLRGRSRARRVRHAGHRRSPGPRPPGHRHPGRHVGSGARGRGGHPRALAGEGARHRGGRPAPGRSRSRRPGRRVVCAPASSAAHAPVEDRQT